MKGELASLARRRAISVLPTPVGPIMMMFLGMTSSANSGVSFWRRMRLRRAMATARLAWFWPTTYLSSSRNDFARRQLVECDVLVIGSCGKINSHSQTSGGQWLVTSGQIQHRVSTNAGETCNSGLIGHWTRLDTRPLPYSSSIVNLSLV